MTNRSDSSGSVPFTPAGLPPISLIIASRNRPQLLRDAVESILNGNEVPREIVIIDQGDRSNSFLAAMKTVHECEIRYQWSTSVGLSFARNHAIRLARYEYLAVTDDDVLADPNWLSRLIQALVDEGPNCVVSGRVLVAESSGGGFAPSLNTEEESADYQGRIWKDALWTGNMAMHRSVVSSIGFFDERLGPGSSFPGAEDNDYGFRLLEAGFRIKYVPEAIIYHRAWRTANDYIPLRWNYGYGQGAFFAKHSGLRDGYMLQRMRSAIMRHGSRLVRDGLRRSRRQNLGDAVYILGLMCGAAKWLLTQPKMR